MGSVCTSVSAPELGELTRRVREHALAEDGQEARVQPAQALLAREPREAGDEPARVVALGYQPDARCLERREQDVREEPAQRAVSRAHDRAGGRTHSATLDAPR